jgi:hypothetical protein
VGVKNTKTKNMRCGEKGKKPNVAFFVSTREKEKRKRKLRIIIKRGRKSNNNNANEIMIHFFQNI